MRAFQTAAWRPVVRATVATAAVGLMMAATGSMAVANPQSGPADTPSVSAFPDGPRRVHVLGNQIDLKNDRILIVAQGRDIDTAENPSPLEANFADKMRLLTDRGIPLTGINVYGWTGVQSRVVAHNTYVTWSQLDTMVHSLGGAITSEGVNHEKLTTMDRTGQWQDTCGVLKEYSNHGLNASAMYSYAGGPSYDTLQSNLVDKCYAFGRQYALQPNTMFQMRAPWYLKVASVNGGCPPGRSTCLGGAQTPKRYLTPDRLSATLTPAPGQVSVLQYYHLVSGKTAHWDCTSAVHQSDRTEVYCLADIVGFIDHLPADVKVATVADLAQAVGRSPGQLPGLSLQEWLNQVAS